MRQMDEYLERRAVVMRLMQDGCSAKNVQSIMDLYSFVIWACICRCIRNKSSIRPHPASIFVYAIRTSLCLLLCHNHSPFGSSFRTVHPCPTVGAVVMPFYVCFPNIKDAIAAGADYRVWSIAAHYPPPMTYRCNICCRN